MGRAGFVVRFVDLVLILLFGFISISAIRTTEIALPSSTETPAPPPELREVLFVGIRADGTYLVDDERTVLPDGWRLRDYLASRAPEADGAVAVRLRASHDTPMRYLIEAARICDALGLPKAFEVQLAGPERSSS